MTYTVRLTKQADKDLMGLSPDAKMRAVTALQRLKTDPQAGHLLTGSLQGARSLEFSLPGGAYRAAYISDSDSRTCLIFIVGPHENFYQKAERRYRHFGR
ncbi:MAG: type II toxin-antitoxin system RelE/ParE family toxin [Bacilli bacterium]